MENKIKISVIIPVYNTVDFLDTCLDSLFLQKYKNVEYVIVDDGSTDGSLELCQKYAAKDERFVVFSKENGGPSSARNLALEKARGEYITFVDSDDFIATDAYEKIDALLTKHGNPDVLVFGANLVPEYAKQGMYDLVATRDVVYESFTPDALLKEVGARPFLWLQVVKRDLIVKNDIKMDETIDLGEDQLFQMEFFPFANKIVFVSDKFYYYRWLRDNSLMKKYGENATKKLLAHVNLIDKVFCAIFTDKYSEELKNRILSWSIFFMWGDLIEMLEANQVKIASALVKVWEKHNCNSQYDNLDVWGKLRYNQITLMGIEDKDKKIEEYKEEIAKIKEEVEALKKKPEYKKILKQQRKENKLCHKGWEYLKTHGLIRTLKKVKNKLKYK